MRKNFTCLLCFDVFGFSPVRMYAHYLKSCTDVNACTSLGLYPPYVSCVVVHVASGDRTNSHFMFLWQWPYQAYLPHDSWNSLCPPARRGNLVSPVFLTLCNVIGL